MMSKRAWLSVVLLVSACSDPDAAHVSLGLPQRLALDSWPAASVERLRAVANIPGVLSGAELEVDRDAWVARGTFTVSNKAVNDAELTVELSTAFTIDGDAFLVGRSPGTVDIRKGRENRARLGEMVTDGEPIFDINRNGRSNLDDLIAGMDPLPGQLSDVDVSPETISFESGVEVGGFTRSFFVVENGSDDIVEIELGVRLIPGVTIVPLTRLLENGGGTAATDESLVLAPDDEEVFALTFAPVNPTFAVGSLSVAIQTPAGSEYPVSQATSMRILGNPEGAIPQAPADYDIPLPDAGDTIGTWDGTPEPYPIERLFSRLPLEIPVAEEAFALLTLGAESYDVDRAWLVDVLPYHRFGVTVDNLSDDVDVRLFELDRSTFDPVAVLASSVSTGASSEAVEFDGTTDDDGALILVALDKITLVPIEPTPGGLTEDGSAMGTVQTAMFSVPEIREHCPDETPDNCLPPVESSEPCPDTYGAALACGAAAGNTQVVLRGRNFRNGALVRVGGKAAICASVVHEVGYDEIRCVTPPASEDPEATPNATVTLTNPDQQTATLAEGFTYLPPAPVVVATSPRVGPTTGGTPVQIYGSHFFSRDGTVPEVLFGDAPAVVVAVADGGTRVDVVAPPCSSCADGTEVDVAVANPDGQVGTLPVAFRYTVPVAPAPTVTAVAPAQGSTDGGELVTITGTGLDAETVRFGGVSASIQSAAASSVEVLTPAHEAGWVQIEVVNSDGQTGRLESGFQYVFPSPSLVAALPAQGEKAGGTVVLLSGTGFQPGAEVRFGGERATQVAVNSASSIICTTPPGPLQAGDVVVDIELTNLDGQSATLNSGFTYMAVAGPAPTITSIENPAASPPNMPRGSIDGGDRVTVRGTAFALGARVFFGQTNAPAVTVVSATELQATTPAHPAGRVDVTVRNVDGQMAVAFDAFEFEIPPPMLSAITPTVGPTNGGTTVLLTGQRFRPGAAVFFGAQPATSVAINGSTLASCVSPAGVIGTVGVSLRNLDGQAADLPAAFEYVDPGAEPPPTIFNLNPANGPAEGGTLVVVSGNDFDVGGLQVFFGGNLAQVVGSSATEVEALSPPGTVGATVSVRVQNSDGQSAAAPFTYTSDPPTLAISGVIPRFGGAEQNSAVLIAGQAFEPGARVRVTEGGWQAELTNVAVLTGSLINATMPAYGPTAVNVVADLTVENPDGSSAALTGGFTYTVVEGQMPADPPPVVHSIEPSMVPESGDMQVRLAGEQFVAGSTQVFLGTSPVTLDSSSATELLFTAPAASTLGLVGGSAVQVRVENPDGQWATAFYAYSHDAYMEPPSISRIDPGFGVPGQVTAATLYGSNIDVGAVVFAGGMAAAVTDTSGVPTELDVELPSFPDEGIYTVELFNPDGMFATTAFVVMADDHDFYVSDIQPKEGRSCGGDSITIWGDAFSGTAVVRWGGVEITTPGEGVSGNSITFTNPSGTGGVMVEVLDGVAGPVLGSLGFYYLPDPSITGVVPSWGLVDTNNLVMLIGDGFAPGDTVEFRYESQSYQTTMMQYLTPNQITIDLTAPGGGSGLSDYTPVDVRITDSCSAQDEMFGAFTWIRPGSSEPGVCEMGETLCLNGNDCIPESYVCDGYIDCSDFSDELTFPTGLCSTCTGGQFTCMDGSCISDTLICDYNDDCADGSDETAPPFGDCTPICPGFQCWNGDCAAAGSQCNTTTECTDGSDEWPMLCGGCNVDEIMCANGRECVTTAQWCDTTADCADGSDESDWACHVCPAGWLTCDSGTMCVEPSHVCDTYQDCIDNTDETGCSGSNPLGAPCPGGNGDCASTFCRNGVCCESACDASCWSCSSDDTGLYSGLCRHVTAGTDPNGNCSMGSTCALGSCIPDSCFNEMQDSSPMEDGVDCGLTACGWDCPCEVDGIQNNDEIDVDCGGIGCPMCQDGARCALDFDCMGGHCPIGICASVGMATRPDGAPCTVPGDCDHGSCVDNVCCESDCLTSCYACSDWMTGQPSGLCRPIAPGRGMTECGSPQTCDGAGGCSYCFNGQEDTVAGETDVDCGGPCLGCTGAMCGTGADCASGVCSTTCVAPTCGDGVQNQLETDVDCGGPNCGPCIGAGFGCLDPMDCDTGMCLSGGCVGSTPAVLGTVCTDHWECASGLCVDGVCCETLCYGDCSACNTGSPGYCLETGSDYACQTGECVNSTWVCDQAPDCADGSDEGILGGCF